jgi:transcriptional regulator with XRE-family HTH domain
VSLKERFSANLKKARRRAGVSQTELASMTELHRTQISNMENGKTMPRLDTVAKLISALNCSADELIEGMVWKPNFKTCGSWEVTAGGRL